MKSKKNTTVGIIRVAIGLIFIFSGLIKLNDPIGFSYKLKEYFEVFDVRFFDPYAIFFAVILCLTEIKLGVVLLLGVCKKAMFILLFLLTVFFGFLTFYSAWFGVVAYCGCFGDAIRLSPWESFVKDVILFALIAFLYIKRKYIRPVLPIIPSILIISFSVIVSMLVGLYAYYYLPFIDFLPYKEGNHLPSLMVVPKDKMPVYKTVYNLKNKATGETKTMEDKVYEASGLYNDGNWEISGIPDRILVKKGMLIPPITDFVIYNEEGRNVTDDLMQNHNYSIFIIEHNLYRADKKYQEHLNSISKYAYEHRTECIALSSASSSQIEEFRKSTGAVYPIYFCDDVPLRSFVRSNPGLVLMRKGTVIKKWPAAKLPSISDLGKYIDS